jgi:4-diphosphocytidyl-2-C-methyl-D-erythritol kinase
MHVRSSASGLEVLAPAKLNLILEVLGKRPDGFHEIETLMAPIGLYDTLYFQDERSGKIDLFCEQVGPEPPAESGEELPDGSQNIVFRAVDLLRRRYAASRGARVRLIKRIPLAAGLAGGSSDAAAALVAANRCWELDLPKHVLASMAAELGSDVPFFLESGPAICRGRGERIERVAGLGALSFVVVRPPAGLSTAEVYRVCRPAAQPRSALALVESLQGGKLHQAGRWLHNALQAAAEQLSPWIVRMKQEFSRLDCLGHQMSGSGTSYFALARHFRHAQRLAARLEGRSLGRIYVVRGAY